MAPTYIRLGNPINPKRTLCNRGKGSRLPRRRRRRKNSIKKA
jgi:hypothetical protein